MRNIGRCTYDCRADAGMVKLNILDDASAPEIIMELTRDQAQRLAAELLSAASEL